MSEVISNIYFYVHVIFSDYSNFFPLPSESIYVVIFTRFYRVFISRALINGIVINELYASMIS